MIRIRQNLAKKVKEAMRLFRRKIQNVR